MVKLVGSSFVFPSLRFGLGAGESTRIYSCYRGLNAHLLFGVRKIDIIAPCGPVVW